MFRVEVGGGDTWGGGTHPGYGWLWAGGALSLEKGTNCGPTAAERWLLKREMAKRRGLSSYYIVR